MHFQRAFLHEHLTPRSIQEAMTGCLCPITSFWSGCLLLGQFTCHPDPSLVDNMLQVLQQGILRWWNVFHCLVLLTEQLSPCFIDRFQIAHLVIEDDGEVLQNLEVLGLHGQWSV